MKIYWTMSSIPELAALPKAERVRVWRMCYWASFRRPLVWVGLALCATFIAFGSRIGEVYGHEFIGGLAGSVIGGFVWSQLMTVAMLPAIRDAVTKNA